MAMNKAKIDERDFSIELSSNKYWRPIFSNCHSEGVIIEGTLGQLQQATFVEAEILEVKGSHGVLRIYLKHSEITGIDADKKFKESEIE